MDESTKQEFISVFENTKTVRNDYKRWCDQRNLDSYDEFLKAFESIKQRYDECRRDFDVNKSILDRLNDTYNNELSRITDLENKIKLLTSEQSLEHLYQTQDQIKEEMAELEYDKSIKGNYSDYKYLYTTYESIINIIKEINEYSLQSLEIIKVNNAPNIVMSLLVNYSFVGVVTNSLGVSNAIIQYTTITDKDLVQAGLTKQTSYPERIYGFNYGTLLWDMEKNIPTAQEEKYQILFGYGIIYNSFLKLTKSLYILK